MGLLRIMDRGLIMGIREWLRLHIRRKELKPAPAHRSERTIPDWERNSRLQEISERIDGCVAMVNQFKARR